MTTALRPDRPELAARIVAQLRRRPTKRVIKVGHQLWNVTIDTVGVTFRQYRHRTGAMALTWGEVLGHAERRAGDLLYQERLRERAVRRIGRPDRKTVVRGLGR